MTNVTVVKKDGHVASVVAEGHTGYAVCGKDVVCAALSSVIQTAAMGLKSVAKIGFRYETDADKGRLEISLGKLNDTDRHNADMILDTMLCGITDIAEGYPRFIKLEVK